MVPAVAAQSHAYWAARTLWRGDLAAAEEEAGAAFVAMQQAGSSPALEAFAGLQYGIRREQRRLGELAMVVQLAKARAPGLPLWNVVEATVVATDRPADAAAIVEPLRGHVASVPWDLGRPMTLALLVELALSLDDLDLAAEAAGELARWSGRIANLSFPVALGPVDRLLGAVAARQGDHERAASLFAAAHRLIDGLDCVVWQAHLAVDHAAALALAGDPDPARQRLAEATAMAGAHGLTFVAARAAALPRF
jgi:tetratricopeptide (TPR) repeat protein